MIYWRGRKRPESRKVGRRQEEGEKAVGSVRGRERETDRGMS